MRSQADAPTVLRGDQRPRHSWVPPYSSSAGAEAVELAALAGLNLDPWQAHVLTEALGERRDGRWAAFEVGVVVARQNGKGGILEARELAGLFLLGEPLIIHSAHQFDTSIEAFRRLLALIEDTPELDRRVARVVRSHGEEGVELKTRQRIRFRTRTKGGGRGFSCDCLILDEAMILPKTAHGALLPTLSARENVTVSGPQVWYTGSAVDEDVHEHGVVLSRIRERGMAGGDPRLMYMEWSADPSGSPVDPQEWAAANPGLGIRIPEEHVAAEQRSMDPRTFSVERLSLGRWPKTDEDAGRVITRGQWDACRDPDSTMTGTPVFSIDVTPDRGRASIAKAGLRADGQVHVELVENRDGTGWVVDRCATLKTEYRSSKFVVDPRSPAGTLLEDLKSRRVRVDELTTVDYGRACGVFFDLVTTGKARHPRPVPEIDIALAGAAVRPLGDAWSWDRRSIVDISPLVAMTTAVYRARAAKKPRAVNLAEALARDEKRRLAEGVPA